MQARRLYDRPLITARTPGADPLMRQNINGPCLLRRYLLCTVQGEQGSALAELV